MEKEGNLILDLTFDFAIKIIDFCELLEEKRKYVIAKQLLRSGTAVGSIANEAHDAESKADFIHKLKIGAKEARETRYWLRLCQYSKSYPFDESLLTDLDSIQKVLNKIIATSKKNKM
ncbi:MAG: four helix bundle protein [Cyclobacteriaceae bacterium]|nr:four helix bundle protein [Cyclobacteriaceae bacterium]